MSKYIAYADSIGSLFNTKTNELGEVTYDFSEIKQATQQKYNIDYDTVCFIKTNNTDQQYGFSGSYIYTRGLIFGTDENRFGQFIVKDIKNKQANDTTLFMYGKVVPTEQHTPWQLCFHIQAYTNSNELNAAYDVCVCGNNDNVITYEQFLKSSSLNVAKVMKKDDDKIKFKEFIKDSYGITIQRSKIK